MSLLDLDKKTRDRLLESIGMTLKEYQAYVRQLNEELKSSSRIREQMRIDGVTAEQISRRILEMVGKLHDRGYESLYIDPTMSPSGGYWRYSIGTMVDGFWPCAQIKADKICPLTIDGSIGGGYEQEIPWSNPMASLEQFVDGFCATYPELLNKATNPNSQYVIWYKKMLQSTHPNGVMVFWADYCPNHEYAFTFGYPRDFSMPMPPGYRKESSTF